MEIVTKAVATLSPVDHEADPDGEFDVILSTPTKDRDGENVKTHEWKMPLPEHVTFDSDHEMRVATTVGSGKPFINADGALQVRGTYASTDHAQNVRKLVPKHIRHVSVEMLVHKDADGNIVRELLGGSFVKVPANTEAVVLSSKGAGGGHKHDEPYGNVAYADPGFRGPKRYPINTPEHVRAAWDYFHHANDSDKYSAAEQHHIEDEIRTAARKFGIKLEGDSKKDACESAETKAVGDGASNADAEQTGVEAVLRNALTSLKTAVQLHNGQGVPDALDATDGTYPHLQMIHDAAVQLGGKCSSNMASEEAQDGQVWGANSPTISAPQTSGKSAVTADATAEQAAADAAATDRTEALAKAKRLAITLSSID